MLDKPLRPSLLCAAVFLIAACGSNGGTDNVAEPAPSLPLAPDGETQSPVPPLTYRGKTAPIDSSELSMLRASKAFIEATSLIEQVRYVQYWGLQQVTGVGETYRVTVKPLDTDEHSAEHIFEFTNHSANELRLDGRVVYRKLRQEIPYTDGSVVDGQYELNLENLLIQGQGRSWRVSGSFQSSGALGDRWTGSLLAQDDATGEQVAFRDFSVDVLRTGLSGPGITRANYQGTLLLSEYGRVTLSTEHQIPLPSYFERGGYWYIDGDGDGNVTFSFADGTQQLYPFGGLRAALVKQSAEEPGRRVALHTTWTDINDLTITAPSDLAYPIANPGADIRAEVGQEVRVHGLFSRFDADSYLNHSWRVAYQPTTSAALQLDLTSPILQFTPDVPGRYVFTLRVSDGRLASESSVWVQVTERAADGAVVTQRGQLEILSPLALNRDVPVSALSVTRWPLENLPMRRWRPGEQADPAHFLYQDVLENTLRVEEPGYWMLSFDESSSRSQTWAAVGGDPFEVGVDVADPRQQYYSTFLLGDYSGHGGINLIAASRSASLDSSSELVIYSLNPDAPLEVVDTREFLGDAENALLGDFNNDGRADVVAIQAKGFALFLQDVEGGLGEPAYYRHAFEYESDLRSIIAGDMTGDGLKDLVALSSDHRQLTLWNQGATGLNAVAESITLNANAEILDGGLEDLNDDGLLDIIAAVPGTVSDKQVFFNTGKQAFTGGPTFSTINREHIKRVHFADVDQDGLQDILFLSHSEIEVFLQLESGQFQPHHRFEIDAIAVPAGVLVTDLNGDGSNDIAVKSSYTLTLAMQAEGGWVTSHRRLNSSDVGSAVHLAAHDINHDGQMDLLLSASAGTPALAHVWLGGISKYAKPVELPTEN